MFVFTVLQWMGPAGLEREAKPAVGRVLPSPAQTCIRTAPTGAHLPAMVLEAEDLWLQAARGGREGSEDTKALRHSA